MRLDHYDLDVPGSVAEGDARNVEELRGKIVQGIGAGWTAAFDIEASTDGEVWSKLGTIQQPGDHVDIGDAAWVYLRANTTAWTSGTPAARLSGLNTRTV